MFYICDEWFSFLILKGRHLALTLAFQVSKWGSIGHLRPWLFRDFRSCVIRLVARYLCILPTLSVSLIHLTKLFECLLVFAHTYVRRGSSNSTILIHDFCDCDESMEGKALFLSSILLYLSIGKFAQQTQSRIAN